ncbi:PEP-CTERM sorting domain-containing protein [Posidoniimonas polymericola]|nr:PEP-CTERM sorting domain-containing protein [Posidoniimonas polymericola]
MKFANLYDPLTTLVAMVVVSLITSAVDAHTGRRFVVEVVGGQLRVQGENTGASDGAPAIRDYPNSIHDHWVNVTPAPGSLLGPFASAFLPDFEVPIDASFTLLKDHELSLHLTRASQWADPPAMPTAGVVPTLTPLDAGQVIRIESTGGVVDTTGLGSLVLSPSVPPGGILDIPVNYQVGGHPSNTIHLLEFTLSATPTNPSVEDVIADSDPIYIMLAPDGPDKLTREHYASLYLEEYLATVGRPVPEPATIIALLLLTPWAVGRRPAR